MEWLGEQYGNIASVVGLLISLVTLLVAARTQQKIAEAKNQVISQVGRMEALWSASSAELHLAEIMAFCDGKNWILAADRCRSAIKALNQLRVHDILSAADLQALARGVDDLGAVLTAIEAKSRRNDDYGLDARKSAIIANFSLVVSELRGKVSRLVREV
jgi:hypothetical protein